MCEITTTRLKIGLKGNPAFLDEDFAQRVRSDESFWTLEDGELHIQCDKLVQGESWASVLKGHTQIDAFQAEADQKSIMLQRFQAEHAGFDFSSAEFNGTVPDAANFMGGMPKIGS